MKRTILLISVLLFAVLLSAQVLASGTTTVSKVENVDGKIGLYIRNDIGLTMRTDNEDFNTSVLNYYVDGVNFTSIPAESADTIPTDVIKLVVIDHAWPETGLYELKVVFTDNTGYSYDPEYAYVFAKPGIGLVESRTNPSMVTSNSSFTIYLDLIADGEEGITELDAEFVQHPSYYVYTTMTDGATSLSKGDTTTYAFTYKLSGQSMRDTLIYDTVAVPIEVRFKYLNKTNKMIINESVVIFNKAKIGNNLPEMKALMDTPATFVRGNIFDIPVYVWNTKAGTHSACNMNLTLEEESGKFEIPIFNILPSDMTFPPAVEQASDPTATFQIEIPGGVSEGDYTLTLNAEYKDCEWKAPGEFKYDHTVSVVQKTVIPSEPETNDTIAPDTPIGDLDDSDVEKPKSTLKTYLLWGVILLAIILAVVFLLEKRGRYI